MKAPWGLTHEKEELRALYLSVLPTIREVARESGYAIGVHGSMTRDLDLIAAPWTDAAISGDELMERIMEAVADYPAELATYFRDLARRTRSTGGSDSATPKPHGRVAWLIFLGGHAHIDLSVMPLGAK